MRGAVVVRVVVLVFAHGPHYQRPVSGLFVERARRSSRQHKRREEICLLLRGLNASDLRRSKCAALEHESLFNDLADDSRI